MTILHHSQVFLPHDVSGLCCPMTTLTQAYSSHDDPSTSTMLHVHYNQCPLCQLPNRPRSMPIILHNLYAPCLLCLRSLYPMLNMPHAHYIPIPLYPMPNVHYALFPLCSMFIMPHSYFSQAHFAPSPLYLKIFMPYAPCSLFMAQCQLDPCPFLFFAHIHFGADFDSLNLNCNITKHEHSSSSSMATTTLVLFATQCRPFLIMFL